MQYSELKFSKQINRPKSKKSKEKIADRLKKCFGIGTVERYIDILERCYIIFTLPSYAKNQRSELKFARKLYFWNMGIRNGVKLSCKLPYLPIFILLNSAIT